MNDLVLGFYGEGIREYGFLMPVVERTLQRLVPEACILPFDIHIKLPKLSQKEKMIEVARQAYGFNVVVFHLDADGPNKDRAFEERFEPGFTVIQSMDKVNKDLVPIIPVRMGFVE